MSRMPRHRTNRNIMLADPEIYDKAEEWVDRWRGGTPLTPEARRDMIEEMFWRWVIQKAEEDTKIRERIGDR